MFDRFTEKAKEAILLSKQEAKGFGSDCVDTEHLLLGLSGMNEGRAVAVLRSFGLSAIDLRAQIGKLVSLGTAITVGDRPFTEKVQAVFRLATGEARHAGYTYIGTGHLLLGLCRQAESVASEVLATLGVTTDCVRNELLRLQQKYTEFIDRLQLNDPPLIPILGEYGSREQRASVAGIAGADIDYLKQAADEAPIIRLVDLIMRQAIKERAKEIHIEPLEDKISLQFLIDGAFVEIVPPARHLLTPIVSRFKTLARLNLTEQRKPQEGTFVMFFEGRETQWKVLTKSIPGGEKVVIVVTR